MLIKVNTNRNIELAKDIFHTRITMTTSHLVFAHDEYTYYSIAIFSHGFKTLYLKSRFPDEWTEPKSGVLFFFQIFKFGNTDHKIIIILTLHPSARRRDRAEFFGPTRFRVFQNCRYLWQIERFNFFFLELLGC